MITEDINLDQIIADQLELKYKKFNFNNFKTISNMAIDSLYPTSVMNEIRTNRYILHSLSSNFAFSEYIANMTKVRQITTNELFSMFDINTRDLKKTLIKLKQKKINLVMVGFGGGGINFWYWLEKILNELLVFNIFNSIKIFDNDSFDFTNLMRIPYDLRTKDISSTKIDLAIASNVSLTNDLTAHSQLFINETATEIDNEDTIIIGGPDLETRKILSDSDNIFLSITHGNNEIGIYLNPEQDTALQVESYGMIELNYFFLNQFITTISLINYLVSDECDLSKESLLRSESKPIIDFDSSKFFNEDKYIFNGKTYRFKPQYKKETTDV